MEEYKIQFENIMSGENEIDTTVSSTLEVIAQYKSIKWSKFLTIETDENKNCSDIFEENSWSFSVEFEKDKKEYILHIFPDIYPTVNSEAKFVVEFKCIKIVPSSKLIQFFGGSKEKKIDDHQRETKNLLLEETLKYLSNFLN